ncbi:hypothetical protein GCK32_002501 [Trichostrongylus colubriformis]|uniref:Peptidase A2 domain-containing protein n=1 Tax=Trichostrongylus colubriformis TaxID=6319 RepID=A0AAN8FMH7_TRICO
MVEDGKANVHAVNHFNPRRQHKQPQSSKPSRLAHNKNEYRWSFSSKPPPSPCWLCGAMHLVRHCSYRRHKCSECQKIGHKDGFCQSRIQAKRSKQRSTKPITRSDAVFKVSKIDCSYRRFATILVDDKPIHFQVDTAADITIINESTWKSMGRPHLQPATLIAHSASGDRIHFLGQRKCTYSFNSASAQGVFYVGRTQPNLLGSEWISKMGIYSIMDSLPEAEAFQKIQKHPPPSTSIARA